MPTYRLVMLTTCPRVIDCTLDYLVGKPLIHSSIGAYQELVLSKEKPVVFLEKPPDKKEGAKSNEGKFVPIKSLNVQSGEDWVIKARVTKKGKKVSYSNGCLFKIELIDEEGTQIECTCYKDTLDIFYDKIEEGKIYTLTKASIANANKKFTSIQNDFRIIFTTNTEIKEYIPKEDERQSVESSKFQRHRFNFVSISEILHEIHELKQIDVCGIVDSGTKYDMLEINFEHGKGKVNGRLSFTLIDKTLESIPINLWGELSKLDIFEGDLVVINGARVSNFGGRSLNCG